MEKYASVNTEAMKGVLKSKGLKDVAKGIASLGLVGGSGYGIYKMNKHYRDKLKAQKAEENKMLRDAGIDPAVLKKAPSGLGSGVGYYMMTGDPFGAYFHVKNRGIQSRSDAILKELLKQKATEKKGE